MTREEYKHVLQNMHKELESLLEKQEEIEQQIAQLKQGILAIAPLTKEPRSSPTCWPNFLSGIMEAGITDSIRDILRATYPKASSPVEIKDQLKSRGQDLSQHKNVMASIHSTLKRMLENGEIKTDDEGLTYCWHRRHLRHVPGARRRYANPFADTSRMPGMPPVSVRPIGKTEGEKK
jgi:hypothetical protein